MSHNKFRSPIVSILGHVDVGKTNLLDKLQYSMTMEPGNITQQINTSFIPQEILKESIISKKKYTLDVPGLLILDTPGHESFISIRSKGARICDIAIVVVDIFKGLQQQTIESIKLLQENNTPFIIALNKIDQLHKWKSYPDISFRKSLKTQPKNTLFEFNRLKNKVIVQLAEICINGKLYYEIKDFNEWVAIVPISALTTEGISDLLLLMTQYTQKKMKQRITVTPNLKATVLEINSVTGLGNVMDLILINGTLDKGDQILVCGRDGPIITTIKSIPYVSSIDYVMPPHMEDSRTNNIIHKSVTAGGHVKIVCPGGSLKKAVPGSSLLKVNSASIEEDKIRVMEDYQRLKTKMAKEGIYIVAPNLGALEAMIHILDTPIVGFNIGPYIRKKDVIRGYARKRVSSSELATEGSVVERQSSLKDKVILGFNVTLSEEAKEEATRLGVTILTHSIIYQMMDMYTKYKQKIDREQKQAIISKVVFPCVLQILPQYIFHTKDPITVGVKVVEGVLKLDTPLTIPTKDLDIGTVSSIRHRDKEVESTRKGQEVSISITGNGYLYGRHFDDKDILVSKISRKSLNGMKKYFLEDVKKHLPLLKRLKQLLRID